MRTTTCLCGVELSAETMDALVDVVLAHAGEDHPEIPLAFAGNPAWAGCYCMCHHCGSAEWPQRRAAENRADLIERIRAGATTGLLAYVDGKPAAWCNASPRSTLPEHVGHDEHPDDAVGCLVCFVVAPPYRCHGLASRLLDAALESFEARGFTHAEAYPRREIQGDPGAYHGPLGLYLSRGFEEAGREGNVVTVQKALTGA